MEDADLSYYAKLLDEVIDVFSVLVDPAAVPEVGSLATDELRAAREQQGHGAVWGDEPILLAYETAMICYRSALESGKAMVALMNGRFSAVPVSSLARSLAEVSGQAWWLLEPDIGCVRRVRRLQALRYRSASEGERAAKADGAASDEYHRYTETTTEVEQYSRTLGLDVPRRDRFVYICGEERLATASHRVVSMFADVDVPSVYRLYSGFPHGELFALRQAFSSSSHGDGLRHFQPIITNEAFKGAVAVASYALYPPAARLSCLFGFDKPHAPALD